jgi:hypothetical protein
MGKRGTTQTIFVGDKFTVQRGEIEIVKYEGTFKVTVRFADGYEAMTTTGEIRKGFVMHPLQPVICNVGYRGVGKFTSRSHRPARAKWSDMLHRVYNPERHGWEQYGGRGVKVVEEWHNFQNFAEWITKQANYGRKGFELDKDILKPEMLVYSPETCCLVPKEVNIAMISCGNPSEFAVGVSATSNKPNGFRARVSRHGKIVNIGVFETEVEARQAYLNEKTLYIRSLAEKYKQDITEEVYAGLCAWSRDE